MRSVTFYGRIHARLHFISILLLTIFTCFVNGTWAFAAEGPSSGSPNPDKVSVLADHIRFNHRTHLIHANGHAFLQRGNLYLQADQLILDKKTNVVWASGHVRFRAPKTLMTGPRMKMNLETGHATVYDGKVQTTQFYNQGNIRQEYTYYIHGKTIERVTPDHFHVIDGGVTTCDCLPNTSPTWLLSTDNGDVYLGDHFSSVGDTLDIKGIPAIYLPYFSFPTAPKKSGFLFPFVQFNNIQGVVFYDSFFWNLDPSYDLTFTFDEMSNFGLGEGITYRQSISANQNLSFNILQQGVDDPALNLHSNIMSTTDLYSYMGENTTVVGNINYVSAQDFYQLMSAGSTMTFSPMMMSSVFANFYQDDSEINLAGIYNEDIFPGLNTNVSKLPQGSSNLYDYRLGDSPFYFSSFLSGVMFQSGSIYLQRGVIEPSLDGSFSLGDGALLISPHARVLESAYSTTYTTLSPYAQTIPNFGVTAESTLERNFTLPAFLGGGTLTHQIQFDTDYEYAPQNNETPIIQSGFTDNILGMNTLYYAVTNRFFYNGSHGSEELLSLKLAEDYQLGTEPYNSTPVDYAGQLLPNPFLPLNQPFSPVYASAHILPGNPVSVFGEGFFNPQQGDFQTEDTAIVLNQAALMDSPILFQFQIGQTGIRQGGVPMMGNFFSPTAMTVAYDQPEDVNFLVPAINFTTKMGIFGGIAYYDDLGRGSSAGIQMESFNGGYNGKCWSAAFMYYVVQEPAPLPAQTGFGFTLSLNGIAALAPIINPIMPLPVP
ncbi:organic solvent tolerance protein [Leptospirillum ferriphilum]|uniref:Organic solvent tolerance protein n=1 Tax=Leptospirillum ferriphilum TaxID=178606 RepID=A0A1V3SWN1_9BACT|nr:organic solvent tolerance protein [Leptospirillum ferriphilum]